MSNSFNPVPLLLLTITFWLNHFYLQNLVSHKIQDRLKSNMISDIKHLYKYIPIQNQKLWLYTNSIQKRDDIGSNVWNQSV